MSAELLENIKRQIDSLTTPEKVQLAAFLSQQLEPRLNGRLLASDEDSRRKRMQWLKTHREQYGGQYVALEDDTLIGVGQSYRDAKQNATAAGKPAAFVTYLPKPDEVAESGGWG
jgi:hypothetical protein